MSTVLMRTFKYISIKYENMRDYGGLFHLEANILTAEALLMQSIMNRIENVLMLTNETRWREDSDYLALELA